MATSSIRPVSFRVDPAHVRPLLARATTVLVVAGVVFLAAVAVAVIAVVAPFAGPMTPFIAGAVALAAAGIGWRQIMRRRWLAALVDRDEIVAVDADGIRFVRDVVIDWRNATRVAGADAPATGRGRDAFIAVTLLDAAGPAAGATGAFRSVVSQTPTGGTAVLFLDAMDAAQVTAALDAVTAAARAAGVRVGDESAG